MRVDYAPQGWYSAKFYADTFRISQSSLFNMRDNYNVAVIRPPDGNTLYASAVPPVEFARLIGVIVDQGKFVKAGKARKAEEKTRKVEEEYARDFIDVFMSETDGRRTNISPKMHR